MPPNPGFPAPDCGQKKFNSRPVTPTIFRKKPFGENVEGLFLLSESELRRPGVGSNEVTTCPASGESTS
jgi:hypothetical protein